MLPMILGAVRGAAGVAAMLGGGGIGGTGGGDSGGGMGGGAAEAGGKRTFSLGDAAKSVGAAVSGSGSMGEKMAVSGNAIVKALAPATEAMGKFGQVSWGIQASVQAMSMLGKAIIGIPAAPIKAFAGAISLIQSPVVAVVDALKGFVGAVGAIGSAVSEFVRLSNPVYVQKFNMAMEDLMAVIGKALTPLLESSTTFVRGFADAISLMADPIANFLKAGLDPLMAIFKVGVEMAAPFINIMNVFIKLLTEVARPFNKLTEIFVKLAAFPVEIFFDLLAKAMDVLIAPLTVMARLFGDLMDVIGKFVDKTLDSVRKLLGITKIEGRSVGAAVRPAQIGSIEDYGKRAQQAAFSLGTAAGPDVKTADFVEKIYEYIKSGMWIELDKGLHNLARWVIDGVSGLIPSGPSIAKTAEAGVDAGRRLVPTTDDITLKKTRTAVADFLGL